MVEVTLVAVMTGALAALLKGIRAGDRGLEVVSKITASLAFVALGVVGWHGGSAVAAWLVAGLVLCAAGDILLLSDRAFDLGLATFLLGHAAYVVAFHDAVPIADWPRWVALPVVPASLGAARWLWPHLGRRRAVVSVYIGLISVMVGGALAVAARGALPWTVAVGAGLFYLSDLAVARQRFVRAAFVNRAVGLPLYYAGQILIALSVASGA